MENVSQGLPQSQSIPQPPNETSTSRVQLTGPQGAVTETPKKPSLFSPFTQLFSSKAARTILTLLVMFLFLIGLSVYVFGNIDRAGGRVELVWWGTEHDGRVYQTLIQKFQEKHPNVTVKYERQSGTDYRERLTTALSSGRGPDIFEIHNTWPGMLKGQLSPMPSSVMSPEEYKKSFYPIVHSNFNTSVGLVAIPLEFDALTLFINDEIFASGAKEPPVSWDELKALAESLTQKDPRGQIVQSGVALGITSNIDYWQDIVGLMMIQNKVNPLKPSGVFAEDVFSFYKLFSGRVWDDTLPSSVEAFSKGKVAMIFAPTRESINIVKENPSLRFRTVMLPQLAKNTPSDLDHAYATYWAHSVSSKSKSSKVAWDFLRFMSEKDSLSELNQNIKNFETFARVFPRPEMNLESMEDGLLGSVIRLAGTSTSSFLADNTHDGESGINSKVSHAYKKTIDKWEGKGEKSYVDNLAKDLGVVLSTYGITIK